MVLLARCCSLLNQIHNQVHGHGDACHAYKVADEGVAFFALQETSEVAAAPGAECHDDGDGPVDFSGDAKGYGAEYEKYRGECILEGVHVDGVEAGVPREAENLYEADSHLHDAAVNRDECESEGAFPREFFRGRGRGLPEDVLTQVAHHHHEADDAGEDCLECFVADAYQKADADGGAHECRNQKLEEDFLVQVAVFREVRDAADVPDDEPDAVRAVCDGCRHPEENHDGKAKRAPAACDAVDEANDCAEQKECRVLRVLPPSCIEH